MLATAGIAKDMRREAVTLVVGDKRHVIDAEIAATTSEKSLGLMYRQKLAPDAGMLFLYPAPQEISMWMRNTILPLDMVFIRADGTVERIAADTEPFSETSIHSDADVLAVLELNAGTAARLGLAAGDRVEHAAFKAP